MSRISRISIAWALAGVVVLAARGAAAQDHSESKYEGNRVALSGDIWPTSSFGLATMGVDTQLEPIPNLAIDIGFPYWAFGNGGGNTYAAFGGVSIGARGVGHVEPNIVLTGGIALGIPTTWKDPKLDQFFFDAIASETRAVYQLNRIFPEVLSLRFPFAAEIKLDFFYIRPELAIPIYFLVGDQSGAATVVLETALELEARAPIGVGGGLRFQAAFSLTDNSATGSSDRAQTALEPFVGFEQPVRRHDIGFFARAGLLFALDEPLGFGFDKGKLAVIRLQAGVKF